MLDNTVDITTLCTTAQDVRNHSCFDILPYRNSVYSKKLKLHSN